MKLSLVVVFVLLLSAASLNGLIIQVTVHSASEMQGTVCAHVSGQAWPAAQQGDIPGVYYFVVPDPVSDVPVEAYAIAGGTVNYGTGSIENPISYIDIYF